MCSSDLLKVALVDGLVEANHALALVDPHDNGFYLLNQSITPLLRLLAVQGEIWRHQALVDSQDPVVVLTKALVSRAIEERMRLSLHIVPHGLDIDDRGNVLKSDFGALVGAVVETVQRDPLGRIGLEEFARAHDQIHVCVGDEVLEDALDPRRIVQANERLELSIGEIDLERFRKVLDRKSTRLNSSH